MRLIAVLIFIPLLSQSQVLSSFSKDTLLMGSAFSFTAIHENPLEAEKAVDASINEVIRIERLISSWQPNSQTSQINNQAGLNPVSVDLELYKLIERSLKISNISNGYFDISFASIGNLWNFNGEEAVMPSEEKLQESVDLINYQDIILDPIDTTIFLKREGMKIGFGAIGKGYAADRAKEVMNQYGIESGVVNAGGDVLAWGSKPNGENWNMGIANPESKNDVLATLRISDQAIVTSGDYERFVIIDGERYGHIVNPKTGLPIKGIVSVSIMSHTAELADAIATAVFVLGTEDGMALINHLNGVEGLIITEKNKLLYSNKIKLNLIGE